jgi:hypothetical protein
MFLIVASLPKKLNIAILISATKRNRHDVIEMIIVAQRKPAAGTFPTLQLE